MPNYTKPHDWCGTSLQHIQYFDVIRDSIPTLPLMFFTIRQQTGAGNQEFVRSMIPRYASAILICNRISISGPEIQELCSSIFKSQQSEINQMKQILQRMQK